MAAREGGARRSLGEGYTAVVFDGHHRIAFVSHRGVRFVDGKRDELVETDGPVEGLHFAGGGTLRFAVGREVLEWDPEKGTERVLARIPETQQIFAALAAGDEMLLATVE